MNRIIVLFSVLVLAFVPVLISAQDAVQAGTGIPDTIRIDVPSDLVITGNRILVSQLQGLAMQTPEGQSVGTVEDAVITQEGSVESIVANVEQQTGQIGSGRYLIPAGSFAIGEGSATLDVQQAMQNARMVEGDIQQSIGQSSYLLSRLIGRQVQDRDGQTIGTIQNLVADLELGSVTYAAISLSGVLGAEDVILAFPFDRLSFSRQDTSGQVQE